MNGKNKLLIPALVFVVTLALGGLAIAVALKLRSPETTTVPLPTEAEEPATSEPEPEPTIPVGAPATSACYLTFTASGEEPPEDNQPPVCESLSASPTSGTYPLTVGFEVTTR